MPTTSTRAIETARPRPSRSAERAPASWYPYRGTRVSLVANPDGSFSPRIVKVTLHSAGMLVERQIQAPFAVRVQSFATREGAAAAALQALELGKRAAG